MARPLAHLFSSLRPDGAVCYPDAGNQQVDEVDHADRVGHDNHVDLMVP